eukprot:2345033-Pyramimonas_sp.AAC.1
MRSTIDDIARLCIGATHPFMPHPFPTSRKRCERGGLGVGSTRLRLGRGTGEERRGDSDGGRKTT